MDTYDFNGLEQLHINFRKHHNNPLSLEKFPLLESVSEVMPIGSIHLLTSLFLSDSDSDMRTIIDIYGLFTNVIMCSSQIAHRLAHRRTHEYNKDGVKQFYIPDFVKWLQDNGYILSNEHHRLHHKTEVMNYCISNGSSSSLFDTIIDILNLPVSTYSNSNNRHKRISRESRRKIINETMNHLHL